MDARTLFGVFGIATILVAFANERRSHWWTLVFAAGCVLAAVYAFLVNAWPFGVLSMVWYLVAMRRWVEAQPRP